MMTMGIRALTDRFPQVSAATFLVLALLAAAGCGDPGSSANPTAATGPSLTSQTGGESVGDSDGGGGFPSDLSGVVWLHTDVSGWAETGSLRSVTVSGGVISLDYDKADVWPARNHAGANVNANPWIFVDVGGTWHAATFEWLRRGQTSKPVKVVAGDHIEQAPLKSFRPRSGETYGFMVSGLARDSARNVQERTQVLMYTWP